MSLLDRGVPLAARLLRSQRRPCLRPDCMFTHSPSTGPAQRLPARSVIIIRKIATGGANSIARGGRVMCSARSPEENLYSAHAAYAHPTENLDRFSC